MRVAFNNSFTFAFAEKLPKSCNKIYHLASNLLPHYLGIFECLTVHSYNSEAMQNRLITINVYQVLSSCSYVYVDSF